MGSQEDKINLLLQMIAFSVVDGRLDAQEYRFIWLVAKELGLSREECNDLFHQELPIGVIKDEFERVQQFYRLALLMHVDGVLHQKEEDAISQIAIEMGLNPAATSRILHLMKTSPSAILEPDLLLEAFQEQHN